MPDTDQQAIMAIFPAWHQATRNRDLPKLLSLMTEDVVYLQAGQPPMQGRDAFAAAFQGMPATLQIDINEWRLEELHVEGSMAYCRCFLSVYVTNQLTGSVNRRSGYTLTVLRKDEDGEWRLARDANLLTPEPEPAA
ncbi:MAG: putative ketosteroid isomerase protein [Vampirovibrio sp.]|jgi:uncharacterized protein (TIGR02246 family)|nr:putative ketosteroid isomerase protein [Vampirovibrio sp.]